MIKIVLFLAALAVPMISLSQTNERPEILVLGTFHMDSPGRDIFNMKVDDVLAPKRQKEIGELVEVLKKFRPTKIAIEAAVGSQRVEREFAGYLAGKYTLTRNETDQVGYRLAKECGHHAVYPVDESGDFPFQRVMNYAKANGTDKKLDEAMAKMGGMVKEDSDYLESHTLLEMYLHMNAESRVVRDVSGYYDFVRYGDPGDYAGPDLLASWYQRNMRIYMNIVKLIDSPSDRVLVIYGAGHLGWLQQNVTNDTSVKLRKLSELVAAK